MLVVNEALNTDRAEQRPGLQMLCEEWDSTSHGAEAGSVRLI